ncbi:MAG: uroporphyrinogen-III synthase [Actinomycetota bacterium]|nr:uroporphyrinogen-III synthase [Actinomycetota bacterium]
MSALAGRRVVVTRAAEQADDLAALLRARGAVPVVVPLIEIVVETAQAALLAGLAPAEFDWLVVTSPNGAAHYVLAHGSRIPARVAAVGSATAAALRAGGVPVSLVPARQRAEGLLQEFPAGTGRVLVVQAVDAEPTLAAGLAALGWQVTALSPYRSVPARRPAAGDATDVPGEALQAEVLQAEAVLFASGSAARAWAAVFGAHTPAIVVAIGPQTAAVAAEAGLKVTLVATDHSLAGMVDVLDRHLSQND